MHFFLLGSLKVESSGRRISITAPKQRAVLAALLLNANNEVQIDSLIRYVWDARPPATAQTTLQSYIYRLRQLLRAVPGVELGTATDSYLLSVDEVDTDLWYFRRRAEAAREAVALGEPEEAVPRFREALGAWRGGALAGIPGAAIQQEARILEGERIAVYEELFGTEMRLGRHRQIVPELHKVVSVYQVHEAFRAQLMLALYASGRQAEALQHYAVMRRRLSEHFGIEPGQELQELHRSILNRVPAMELSRRTKESILG
ncbi:AfsR/SARP family transcriptional regulator [Actinomadura oligospora]|uniref:AfsR/SARP family transcriptional regulator n=1 Tax=Actinomadura oligospora TaxID=111804 RepID=UPI0014767036|nr:AfsR/SARP family transcriptional regulator [Actinomadura oligospora]